ncbi:MAG TPA: SAM-dependent methyltransferase [Steroidobacteraceae bacterium]
MNPSPIRDVSDTAFMVAQYRAMETERADALFRDPLAARLAGDRGRRIVEGMEHGPLRHWATASYNRTLVWTMAIRTRIIDDFILEGVSRGTQALLNLGAGLDTRPYRMALPESFHWIEVDYPHMIDFKQHTLAGERPRCMLERVALDLADVPARSSLLAAVAARFDKVLVLTEGVIPYLSVEAAGTLADDLASHPSFRGWIVDYISPQALQFRNRSATHRLMKNAPFLFQPTDYFGFFAAHGWSRRHMRYIWDEGQRLKRRIPLPAAAKLWFALRSLVISRARHVDMRKFMAYVLFEPSRGPAR